MSGIAGIIRFDGVPVEAGLVEGMTGAMAYRGPDGINHWCKGPVALGQCMLRTTPESLEECQPLCNDDESLVLVLDGRLDNWEELRAELLDCGAALRDRSDAELVLNAYQTWGEDCLAHLDGDFALVIWDARQHKAFCARDRMGLKPFHYHWRDGILVFASELHPILTLPWVTQVPNQGMLAEFLAAKWFSRDETLWTGVMRLVAAHCMVVGTSGLQLKPYWAPDLNATLPYTTDAQYIAHYRELLFDIVRRQSRSHKPVAIDVSGGLDSSALFCIAERLRHDGLLPAPGTDGYTLAFTGDSAADEIAYARAVGEHTGTTIHEVPPTIQPLEWYAEQAQTYKEFPGFPNADMAMGILREAAKKSCVQITGEGGDHWLQGSREHYADLIAQGHWYAAAKHFRADASVFGSKNAIALFGRNGIFALLPMALQNGLRRLLHAAQGRHPPTPGDWLSPAMLQEFNKRKALAMAQPNWGKHKPGQVDLLEALHRALGAQLLERAERRNARAGIEIRHPFFSHRFVQFAFSTPPHLRLQGNVSKVIHRQGMKDVLPRVILERKDKAEFSGVFRLKLDAMEGAFTMEIPSKRPTWVTEVGMIDLFESYRNNPQSGWLGWVLWSIHVCDTIFEQS